jgi:hypothetical protein
MIDFKKAYPRISQFEEFDAAEAKDEIFNALAQQFDRRMQQGGNDSDFLAYELERMEAFRDNINPPYAVRTLDGISLYPLFCSGWEATRGRSVYIPNNCYKFCPEITQQITDKYDETGAPDGYFEKLTALAMEEYIRGMGAAKYYLFLLARKDKKEEPAIKKEPEPLETQVRDILQKAFINAGELQFNSLIEHITADKRPEYNPKLVPDVTKTALYKILAKLIPLGYDRKHLASVFSDLCSMDYDSLCRKISN